MVGGEGGVPKPALGESWKVIPRVRVLLARNASCRVSTLSVLKHTSMVGEKCPSFSLPTYLSVEIEERFRHMREREISVASSLNSFRPPEEQRNSRSVALHRQLREEDTGTGVPPFSRHVAARVSVELPRCGFLVQLSFLPRSFLQVLAETRISLNGFLSYAYNG